ncbi:CO or xanthine dehydrogenase, FAD-binding subunit [Rhodococcus rhodochrous J3]|uniref:CO or xanthine dehydrogenase, FAD-binding subunit n=1 Tax=Rhodococcus rhodochrous J3 TaxID=903528 RepID=A0ABY1M9F5_RHORH|nr:FAD binding domain-containing protein [Rhodococcus rhodochrous]MBF4476827.1 FAD binding domain-containing protein [Rhodococcus rhodochrous]MCB8912688.1 FAD binding domain-containing protein [Rhodococcus rhodochrous]MCD2096374.1 FAD binding domain-containing protein [Rhodococcus rhodochrous]MCD2121408.1 FAD binding domain-containing protein [Rhodococcus rhodochrous]MCQ4135381.1 FAD binding domain-containing protein [Rhodococcus rhodochrous]
MDLHNITAYDIARDRADLTFEKGAAPLGGGTWLFSEPQPHLHRLVDLSGLDWPAVTRHPDALEIAATCTVEQMAALSDEAEHTAAPLFRQCAEALLASWKIWKRATVGGNICLSFPAGAMISLATALDADAVIWTIDGGERRIPVADFVLGVASNALAPGEILRSIRIPLRVLNSRTVFRKIALSPLGRSGAVVIGRRDDDGSVTLSITASTVRPYLLRFTEVPSTQALSDALARLIPATSYYTDAHGAADWRRAVTAVLAEEIRTELSNTALPKTEVQP